MPTAIRLRPSTRRPQRSCSRPAQRCCSPGSTGAPTNPPETTAGQPARGHAERQSGQVQAARAGPTRSRDRGDDRFRHRRQHEPLSGLRRRHRGRRPPAGPAPTRSATSARRPAATATPAGRSWSPIATRRSRRATSPSSTGTGRSPRTRRRSRSRSAASARRPPARCARPSGWWPTRATSASAATRRRSNTTTLANPANGATNFFNSSISSRCRRSRRASRPTRTRSATTATSSSPTASSRTTRPTRRSGSTTSQDQYLPGVITFATELYAPVVGWQKAVTNLTHPGGRTQRGDVLRYSVIAAQHRSGRRRRLRALGSDSRGRDLRRGLAHGRRVSAHRRVGRRHARNSTRPATGRSSGSAPVPSPTQGGRLAACLGGHRRLRRAHRRRAAAHRDRQRGRGAGSSRRASECRWVPTRTRSSRASPRPTSRSPRRTRPSYVSGATSTIRLIVSNVGNLVTDGSAVTVTDTMPADSFSSLSNPGGVGWSCSIAGLTITCTRADPLAAGDSYPPIVFDATVRSTAPASIVNTAIVAGGGNVDTSNDTASDVGATAQRADVRITKTVAPDTVTNGGQPALHARGREPRTLYGDLRLRERSAGRQLRRHRRRDDPGDVHRSRSTARSATSRRGSRPPSPSMRPFSPTRQPSPTRPA